METKTVSIDKMPVALWREVKAQASRKGMTLQDYVIEMLKAKTKE